ncbi:hypothetical protein Tco_0723570 [Tanacetum coccineum]
MGVKMSDGVKLFFDGEDGDGSSVEVPEGTKLSTLEALKGLILKIPRAITLSLFITIDSREEGAEFEVTGFDKAFDLPTLGITIDLGKGVTEYSFSLEEKGGFPKIDCFANLVFVLVSRVVSFC